jgi:DNA-binding response OmpR family regulator
MSNTILVVNRDPVTLKAIQRTLDRDYDVVVTQCGQDGVLIVDKCQPALAVVDVELADMTGLDFIRRLRPREQGLPCLFISRFGHDASNLEALRLGVTDYIEQPLTSAGLLSAVRRVIADGPSVNETAPERHALIRWADIVVRVVELRYDIKTLEEWARSVAVSVGALRNWCRTANLPARRSLLFARMLRAVIKHKAHPIPPAELLNVVDRRTLVKMLLTAGGTSTDLPHDEQEFLERQRYVTNADALDVLRSALIARGLGDVCGPHELRLANGLD